jgi:hypothetical protein
MLRAAALMLPLTLLVAAAPAGAGGQGGGASDGTPPAFLNQGDEKAKGAFAGPVFLELRDDPSPFDIPLTARLLRLTARIGDGDEFRLISVDWQCGEPAPADPCNAGTYIQVAETGAIQAVATSLLIPEVIFEFGLDPGTVLTVAKLKKYVQAGPFQDADGIFSYHVVLDVGLDTE